MIEEKRIIIKKLNKEKDDIEKDITKNTKEFNELNKIINDSTIDSYDNYIKYMVD